MDLLTEILANEVVLTAVISIAASVGTYLLTLIYRAIPGMDKPGDNALKTVAFVVSVVLAYFVTPVDLPVLAGDPVAFSIALLAEATLVFKAAQQFYDRVLHALMKRVAPSLA